MPSDLRYLVIWFYVDAQWPDINDFAAASVAIIQTSDSPSQIRSDLLQINLMNFIMSDG